MLRVLGCLRFLYNACLQERRDAYKAGVKVSKSTQEKAITVIKNDPGCPDYANIHTHLLQDVVKRVDRSFQNFFDRVKAGKKPGYPRFKGRDRYNTFTFKDAASGNGAEVVAGGKRVRLSGIGNVKVKCHRPMEGVLKTIGEESTRTTQAVNDIADATREQSTASQEVARGIERIATMAEQNKQATHQTHDQTTRLEDLAAQLQSKVSHFRT